jgi:HD superfamily phosphodiesterase
MAQAYDPLNAPNPDDWQSMGEDEHLTLVMEYHREAGVELPNEQVHAVVHVVVENQIVLGAEMSAQATLERLMREGLDRHEAIHAVGSVLVDFVQAPIYDDAAPEANERYNEEVKKLTAADWLKTFR